MHSGRNYSVITVQMNVHTWTEQMPVWVTVTAISSSCEIPLEQHTIFYVFLLSRIHPPFCQDVSVASEQPGSNLGDDALILATFSAAENWPIRQKSWPVLSFTLWIFHCISAVVVHWYIGDTSQLKLCKGPHWPRSNYVLYLFLHVWFEDNPLSLCNIGDDNKMQLLSPIAMKVKRDKLLCICWVRIRRSAKSSNKMILHAMWPTSLH